jgi:hypothetical protein
MGTTIRKPVAPFYAVAVLWLACGLLVPFYKPIHYGIAAVISAAVFFAVQAVCKNGGVIGAEEAPKAEEKPREETTGNAELDKMLKDGRMAIAEMKRLDDNIADPGISADIVRLEQVSEKIFEEVKRDPKKLPKIRRFMDYYLPTTLKLLNSYDRMSATGVSGENIDTTLAKVEGMMRTIVAAFEKQLDSLYGADALDISTDITVLETMMAREGLTGQEMKAETIPNDTEIRLEL